MWAVLGMIGALVGIGCHIQDKNYSAAMWAFNTFLWAFAVWGRSNIRLTKGE